MIAARPVARDDGVVEFALDPPLEHPPRRPRRRARRPAGCWRSSARASCAIARDRRRSAAAREGSGPPVAVLHLEGAEAIDPELEALELWYAAGLRSLGPVWSRPNAFGHGVPFILPSSPDTGPGLTDAGHAAGAALRASSGS